MADTEAAAGRRPPEASAAYSELVSYAGRSHEICRQIIEIGMITFFALPAVMFILLAFTDGDKVVALLIWIVAMFVLALVLILVGYFDKRLQSALENVRGEEYSLGKLSIVDTDYIARKAGRQEERLEEFAEHVKDARESLDGKLRGKIPHARAEQDGVPEESYDVDEIISEVHAEESASKK